MKILQRGDRCEQKMLCRKKWKEVSRKSWILSWQGPVCMIWFSADSYHSLKRKSIPTMTSKSFLAPGLHILPEGSGPLGVMPFPHRKNSIIVRGQCVISHVRRHAEAVTQIMPQRCYGLGSRSNSTIDWVSQLTGIHASQFLMVEFGRCFLGKQVSLYANALLSAMSS